MKRMMITVAAMLMAAAPASAQGNTMEMSKASRQVADMKFLEGCGIQVNWDREKLLALMLAYTPGIAVRDARLQELENEAKSYGRDTVCKAVARNYGK